MKQIEDFHKLLMRFDDEDLTEHRFAFKKPDIKDNIDKLKIRIGFPIPMSLEDLLCTQGAFYNPYFADVWQTLQLYSAEELLSRPMGLLEVIDYEWGGRPELRKWFEKDAFSRLNAENVVFGYRYEDDNVHDYLFFNQFGCFDHLLFDQDSLESAKTKLLTLLQEPKSEGSLEELLTYQIDIIAKAIEEEN